MLLDRHKLDGIVPCITDSRQYGPDELDIRPHPLVFLAHAHMGFVD